MSPIRLLALVLALGVLAAPASAMPAPPATGAAAVTSSLVTAFPTVDEMAPFGTGPWVENQWEMNTGLLATGGVGAPSLPFAAVHYQSTAIPPSTSGVAGAKGYVGEIQMTIHQESSASGATAMLKNYRTTLASGPVTAVSVGTSGYQFTSFQGGETFCTVVYALGAVYGRVSLDLGPQIGTNTTVCKDPLANRIVPAANALVANIAAVQAGTRTGASETPDVARAFTVPVPAHFALSGRGLITASQLAKDWSGDLGITAQRANYDRFVAEYARDGVTQAGLQSSHAGFAWQMLDTAASLPSAADATRLFAMFVKLMGPKVKVSVPGAEVVSASTFGKGAQQQFDLDVYAKGRWNQFYCWMPYPPRMVTPSIAGCQKAAVAAATAWVAGLS